MAVGTIIGLAMMAQGAVATIEQVDVAYDAMAAGRSAAAIARIESNDALDASDPARLINLGIAYARQGDTATARNMFQRVLSHDSAYMLETSHGQWVEAGVLARKALAALDAGTFDSVHRTASR